MGEVANAKWDMNSTWSGMVNSSDNVTILEGIRNKLGEKVHVEYCRGADPKADSILDLDKTLLLAEKAEVIVMTMGERGWWVGENNSHANITLKKNEITLMEALLKTGKPLVVLLTNGRPIIINEVAEKVPAILETWWLGSQAGNAVADVLFGDYNPSGKLPISFPRSIGQIPIYYAEKKTGNPYTATPKGQYDGTMYRDVVNSPLYPFGFGLSYTNFKYDPPILNTDTISGKQVLYVKVVVKNTGPIDGEDVVQLYISDLVASVSQPMKILKRFKKVKVQAGQNVEVIFKLTSADLAIWDRNMEFKAEPGKFKVMTGNNSEDLLEKEFYLK